jgi:hypothetical protein
MLVRLLHSSDGGNSMKCRIVPVGLDAGAWVEWSTPERTYRTEDQKSGCAGNLMDAGLY